MIETLTDSPPQITDSEGSGVGQQRLVLSDSVELWLGDCRDVAPRLGNVDLLVADPPYGMGKKGIMHDDIYGEKLDAFLMECWRACRPALKENASAYIWGQPEDLWRLWYCGGLKDSERMTLRNEIVWNKGSGQGMASEAHRMYPTATERCLFFMLGEQGFNNNADNYWEGWDSVVKYLREEKEKTGWNIAKFKRLAGHSESSGCHWFDRSQWMMPTRETYDAWKTEANGQAFKREHDDLKRDFYATRAHFDNGHQNMTDVWTYPKVSGTERHGHESPKPVAMMARAVKTSCPDGGTVLDPFMGTAPTAIACIRTGRRFIGIEKDPKHFETARKRIVAELAQGDLFLRQNAQGIPPDLSG
jgi:site-specific DNA-methyltransferase (adenine-specific)